uniref:Uncharacterized protein n=1 Tax=Panagrolaimus davidi TaxID=227884 RepID=A0A914PED0_9BILA
MPILIPEILFAIGKQIIENGKSENDVVKFVISGKESLKAARNVFASVKNLKINHCHFAIGWKKEYSEYNFLKIPKCLMYCIGGSVKKLYIKQQINPFFQPIIDTVIEKKQLISFSTSSKFYECEDILFLKNFLPQFSKTLKELSIPNQAMSGILRDSLRLKTLIFQNGCNRGLYFMLRPFPNTNEKSPFLSSVEHLLFKDISGHLHSSFDNYISVIKLFPSLKRLDFITICKDLNSLEIDIKVLSKLIKRTKYEFPQNVIYNVLLQKPLLNEIETILLNGVCSKFKYDSSNPKYHCFERSMLKKETFSSEISRRKLLVYIPKSKFYVER